MHVRHLTLCKFTLIASWPDKALARLQQPSTKMRRYRPHDALMQFLQAL
jgi:hypothetical protein